MTGVEFAGKPHGAPARVLCLGAHSDDIEIGCGGAVLSLAAALPGAHIQWVVFSAAGARREEALASAALFTPAGRTTVELKDFRDGYFPAQREAIKDCFEELKTQPAPDLVLTHWSGDAHQDHRLISELTWNTFRDHWIWEYEVPKYDGDLGRPNLYVPLDRTSAEQKVEHLMAAFASQRSKRWFTPETFWGLMRLRGVECNAPSGYAEAFHVRKTLVSF